jgi:DNA-binding transcriptional MerR regulator
MPAPLTIGDFARATHLSVKALRHYHRIGLLVPAEIDRTSGYRHYATDQIATAHIIRRFRDLDMPLDEIADVVATDDLEARNRLVTGHLDRLERALGATQSAVRSLRDLLGSSDSGVDRAAQRRCHPCSRDHCRPQVEAWNSSASLAAAT